jgi:hypothetical protein
VSTVCVFIKGYAWDKVNQDTRAGVGRWPSQCSVNVVCDGVYADAIVARVGVVYRNGGVSDPRLQVLQQGLSRSV